MNANSKEAVFQQDMIASMAADRLKLGDTVRNLAFTRNRSTNG